MMIDKRVMFKGKDVSAALRAFADALEAQEMFISGLQPENTYALIFRDVGLVNEEQEPECGSCGHSYFDHANGTRACDYRAHGNALECGCGEFERGSKRE